MTTRTVEVERTVTDEEEVTICDDCGAEAEDAVVYRARGSEYPDLHFHEDCLDNVSLEGYEADYVRGAELVDGAGNKVMLVMTGFEVTLIVLGAAIIGLTATTSNLFFLSIGAVFGGLLLLAGVGMSRSQATEPAEWFDG